MVVMAIAESAIGPKIKFYSLHDGNCTIMN